MHSQDLNSNLVCSKGRKNRLGSLLTNYKNNIIEFQEKTSSDGCVIVEVAESEINKVLRQIFAKKPEMIYLCLTNSVYNSINEKNLFNVIKAAGYGVMRSSQLV